MRTATPDLLHSLPGPEPAALQLARLHVKAHISIVGVLLDGTKSPAGKWKPLQDRLPTELEMWRWWGRQQPLGYAAICGAFSAGLMLLDFDNEADAIFPQYKALVEASSPGLMERVSIVRTPKPGWHLWSRCLEVPLPRNVKLARDPHQTDKAKRTLIETRGEGGYGLLPGCPGECHPSGKTYELSSGPPVYATPDLSVEEHYELLDAARAFDIAPPRAVRKALVAYAPTDGGMRPGEDFDCRGDLLGLLLRHGWAIAHERGDVVYLRRPGKSRGVSATFGHCRGQDGIALLKVFTSSTEFEADACYGPFRALAVLEHGNDLSRAGKALNKGGYGERRSTRTTQAGLRLKGWWGA